MVLHDCVCELKLAILTCGLTNCSCLMLDRYNRLNGPHLSEHPILKETLRGEWKSDALVMSDWCALYLMT